MICLIYIAQIKFGIDIINTCYIQESQFKFHGISSTPPQNFQDYPYLFRTFKFIFLLFLYIYLFIFLRI